MWWKKKQTPIFQAPHGKLEVFSRHCFFSEASKHKRRFDRFSRERCHRNLLDTIDLTQANLTYLLDTAKGSDHFIQREKNVVEIREGSEAGAFLRLLDYVESLSLHPETVLYFVEDDYLHKAGWVDLLLEGIEVADYVTLYDHKDKYFLPMYRSLRSQLLHTQSCHWRTIPSTTQTFAVRWKTLAEDLSVHRKFSKGRQISQDHQKFIHLSKRGRRLISSVPGFSTHAEPEFASPCFDWNQL
jgi:glycosyltransferase involved in cell wall biosynthesis